MSRLTGFMIVFLAATGFAALLSAQVNSPPIANAGADRTVNVGEQVQLDGSGSYDPDNDVLFYNWFQTGGPAVNLANANSAFPTFIAAEAGTYVFRLTVNDAQTYGAADEVSITAVETDDDDNDGGGGDDDTGEPYEPANDDQAGCGV